MNDVASIRRSGRAARPNQSGALWAGFAKADITPDEPVYLGGYSLRKTPARYVHGKLFVRALVFERARVRFTIVMADLINIGGAGLRARIADAIGSPAECIYLGDTHNHAAPLASPKPRGAGPEYLGNDGTRWFKRLEQAAESAVKDAVSNLQPVKIGLGYGSSHIAMNRRKRMTGRTSPLTFDENAVSQSFGESRTRRPARLREFDGVVRLGANPRGPIDDEIGLMRIDTMDGRPLAVLINYACHGTSLGGRNDTICGEWMGRMMSVVEEQLGAAPIFLQGAAGDINPRNVGGLDGYADSIRRTDELGDEIAADAIRAYRRIVSRTPRDTALRLASATILLPRCYRDLFQDFKQTAIEAPTTVVRMGDSTFVNFPGEMFHETGKKMKRAASTSLTFIAGYTNGSIGYMPTREAFAEGGYEPAVSHLDPAAEEHYLQQVARLMGKVV